MTIAAQTIPLLHDAAQTASEILQVFVDDKSYSLGHIAGITCSLDYIPVEVHLVSLLEQS